MSQTLKAVRGTRDLLPPETALWNRIEATARAVFARYNFGEIRTPVFEDTALFARGVGEETDIVSKEMYTWEDRARAQSEKTQSLTLRPENTAGVVRAYIEHKLGESGQLQKLYYIGPQFRRERPQKGRYRQFSQIGAEVIGPPSSGSECPLRDAEILEMLATLLDELGITGWTLELNSVGSAADRARYNEALRAALVPVVAQMCADCQRRAVTNPLRVLDCKVPADQPIIETLPVIADSLDEDSQRPLCRGHRGSGCGRRALHAQSPAGARAGLLHPHHLRVHARRPGRAECPARRRALRRPERDAGRTQSARHRLRHGRGPAGADPAGARRVCRTAGGRRLSLRRWARSLNAAALVLARELRHQGLWIELGEGSFRLKKSFEAADKTARRIVILGEDELQSGILTVKTFSTGIQTKVPRAELAVFLSDTRKRVKDTSSARFSRQSRTDASLRRSARRPRRADRWF